MPLGTILVDLSGDAGHEACVAIAARLAGTHASHLIGVAPTGGLDADFSWAASRSLQEASGARDAAALAASRRADRFHDLCRALHVASFESQAVEGDRA